ncbi:MAG: class I SAM-dependent RNA methyltransferase [Rhodospirillales bacterium]|jgi:23S rRNA (uracil1939-C5)-methyltransferase|nr:class I SAM-dependent RNA methyltransferase [Rhodospirillales bacterium]
MTRRRRKVSEKKQQRETVEVTIETLGGRGDGIGELGGKKVFIPFTLPGERVRADTTHRTHDGVFADLTEILELSAERVKPACSHFGECGGCSLQHVTGNVLAEWKRARIIDALAKRGLEDVTVEPTVSVPPGTRRRAVFAYRVTARGAIIGFNARASDQIVNQMECPLLDQRISRLVDPLRGILKEVCRPGAGGDISVTLTNEGPDVCIDVANSPDLDGLEGLGAFGRDHDLARLSWRLDGQVVPVAEFRSVVLVMGEARVAPPPGAFLQASIEGEAAIAERVQSIVADASPVADLFCGLGTFALRLAGDTTVHAVDGDSNLVNAIRHGHIKTEVRDLFRNPLAGNELARFAAVVFDPPRAGAKAQAECLAEAGPPIIAAVSCNPATFARDARILIDGGYRMNAVLPIDQFPWSAHVELVAGFSR